MSDILPAIRDFARHIQIPTVRAIVKVIAERLSRNQVAIAFSCGLIVAPVSFCYALKRLLRFFTEKYTILYDIHSLGVPRSSQRVRGTAVVCGGRYAEFYAPSSWNITYAQAVFQVFGLPESVQTISRMC